MPVNVTGRSLQPVTAVKRAVRERSLLPVKVNKVKGRPLLPVEVVRRGSLPPEKVTVKVWSL